LAIAADAGVPTGFTTELERYVEAPGDIVVEVTGSPAGFAMARALVRPMGTIVLKSTYAGALEKFDASALVVDEVTLVGSRCGPFGPALRLLEQGAIDPLPLIHARYALAQGVEALEHARTRGILKVLIEP
jgi:threonine dehydrogenase-like Zn-dependent dehydrogenase